MQYLITYGSQYGSTEMYARTKRIPLEEQNVETKAMIETYGKKVDFIDFESLKPVFEVLKG